MKLKELERNYGEPMVRMALGHMFEKGMEIFRGITDEEIEECKGNAVMSTEFIQTLLKISREISNLSLWDEILPYIKEEVGIYGITDYKKKSERYACIAYNAICLGQLDEQYEKDDLLCELCCDEEEFDEIMEDMSAYDYEEV